MTFGEYFISKSLGFHGELLSESSAPAEIRAAVRRVEKELKGRYIDRLYNKFPNIQYGDVEDAFDEAIADVKKSPPSSEAAAKRAMRKNMERILGAKNKAKRDAHKKLSCVGAVKSMSGGGGFAELLKRASKVLTSRELKVISLCSQGRPVRKIAEEMGTSFPTAWRTLNAALDKLRMSHGMRPRNLDRRGRG
jgi:DNA-binding NarL/FixJ family response regulator